MFKLILASIFWAVALPCVARQTAAQRHATLVNKPPDTVRIAALYELGLYYLSHHQVKGRVDSAEQNFKRALALATAAHRKLEVNRCNFQLANVYLERNDLIAAERQCRLVASIHQADKSTVKQAQVWFKYGCNLLDKLTDTGKISPARPAELADRYFEKGVSILAAAKDSATLLEREMYIINLFQTRGYNRFFLKWVNNTLRRFDQSSFKQLTSLYPNLSQYYRDAGDNNISLLYLTKALKRMTRLADTLNYHLIYGELALVYDELGQVDKSIEMYKKTLALREKIASIDQASLYRTVGFLMLNLNKKGRSAEGLQYIAGLEKRRPPVDDDTRGMAAQVKAYGYDGLKRYKLAEKYYLQMMVFYRHTNLSYLKYIGLYDVADFYIRRQKFDKGSYYLKEITDKDFDITRNKNIQLMNFKADSAANKPYLAITHYLRYKQLTDSIFNIAKSKQIQELQIKYDIEQKENDLAQIKNDRQLQMATARHATNARNFTLAGLVVVLIAGALLFKSYRTNSKKTTEIVLKNNQLNQLLTEKDKLLEEKEWLMKEVHHRVKNNLQIVMGLLQRQTSFIENKEALLAIQNSEHRLHSIALIHQKLYQADSFGMVNMVDYIDEITTYLRDSFELGERIIFEKWIDDIDLEIGIAVPLALILNEAITNAIKYAFPGGGIGCINIGLKQTDDFDYELRISDNGVGLPPGLDISKINSMGFNLMRGLSKQLSGNFLVSGEGGVAIKMSFCTHTYYA